MTSIEEPPRVHPAACVEEGAILAPGVVVGAFAFVGREVELAQGVEVGQHATLIGRARVGPDCRIFPHAVLGGAPQDTDFKGEDTSLEIGARTVLREHVTVNIGCRHSLATATSGRSPTRRLSARHASRLDVCL